MYITVPIPSRYGDSEHDPFVIDVSEESCATQPFTLRIMSHENRYQSLVNATMSDDDFACLKRVVLDADRRRRTAKENYLEALKVELGLTEDIPDPDSTYDESL